MNRNLSIALSVFVFCLLISGIAIIILTKSFKDKVEAKDAQLEAITDTIQIWKDKDSLNNAKISTITFENTQSFLKLQLGNKEIVRLQNLVKKYEKDLKKGGQAIFVKGETKFDTTYIPKYIPSNYVFTDTVSNKWINLIYKKDTLGTTLSLKTIDDIDIIIGKESKGFLWKTYTPTMKIINNNPYSMTTNTRVVNFEKTFKQKRFGIGPSAGLTLDKNLKVQPTWGFTANYNLIYLF